MGTVCVTRAAVSWARLTIKCTVSSNLRPNPGWYYNFILLSLSLSPLLGFSVFSRTSNQKDVDRPGQSSYRVLYGESFLNTGALSQLPVRLYLTVRETTCDTWTLNTLQNTKTYHIEWEGDMMESGQRVRRVSLPAPISPSYNFANPATTNQGGPARKVSVRPGSIFERLGAEERKLSVIWARHTPGRENLTMSSSHH